MKNFYAVAIVVVIIAGLVGLVYGGWWLKREVNYKLMY